jgi:hypothetical protein
MKMVVLLGIRLNSHVTSVEHSVSNAAEDETVPFKSCLAECWRVAAYWHLVVQGRVAC